MNATDPSGRGIGDNTGDSLYQGDSPGDWIWGHLGPGTWPGGTITGGPLVIGGQPIKGKPGPSLGGPKGTMISPKTSPLSSCLRKMFPEILPNQLSAPTNMGWRKTAHFGTFLGRWAPYGGWCLTALDAVSGLLNLPYISEDYTPEELDAIDKTLR